MIFSTRGSYEMTMFGLRPFSKRPRSSACRLPGWIRAMFQPAHPILTKTQTRSGPTLWEVGVHSDLTYSFWARTRAGRFE